jgi:hypothetical protein
MVIFIVTFIINVSFSQYSSENFKEKTNSLQIANGKNSTSTWLSVDQTQASIHLKSGLKYFGESNNDLFKSEIKTAKLLIADESQSLLYLEIEKAEKAFENVILLKKTFEVLPTQNQKFVKLTSKINPVIIGHIIEEKDDTVSIKDPSGFTTPINKKNIESMVEVDIKEKASIYSELLNKVVEDNGKSSYGLYLSAKWAHQNDLQNKVNSILIEAAMNDSQILMTIADSEAKKILGVAKWSNLIGDYEVAKENAQIVISSYSNTSQFKEAEETLQEILKNIEKEKKIRDSMAEKIPTDTQTASNETTNNKFAEAPIVVEAAPEVVPEEKPKKNTLVMKSQKTEEVNKLAVSKPPEKKEEVIEEKINDKAKPMKGALFQEKSYQDALTLVDEGKVLMKLANSYDNPGNKNAQLNFKKALVKFEGAKNLLVKISKKYAGNTDFEDLAQMASGMHFFITKSCLRL